jgi:hypothetical protein
MDYSPADSIDMVRNVYVVKYTYKEPINSDISQKGTAIPSQLGVDPLSSGSAVWYITVKPQGSVFTV